MINGINFFLLLFGCLVFIPILVLFIQMIASSFSATEPDFTAGCPRITIVIPAHNEGAMIDRTITSIGLPLPDGQRLLVVADNCSDDTAQLAAAAGAEVIERRDTQRIGKGYALDHGVKFLASTATPEVVVFLDADCEISAEALCKIARVCWARGRPVQARYTMQSAHSATPLERISRFAWTVKTLVRPLGYLRLGLPCQLMGTGMAFPWSVIQSVDLATGHIVEDLKLGVDLAVLRKAPLFCPEAEVSSWFPSGEDGRRVQQTRWEHGHLSMIVEYVPHLLWLGISERNLPLIALALDLSVPPLALLAILTASAECVAVGWLVFSHLAGPFLIATIASALFASSIAIAWWNFGRNAISLRDLFVTPGYIILKIPTLFRFFTNRQVAWIRSRRNHE